MKQSRRERKKLKAQLRQQRHQASDNYKALRDVAASNRSTLSSENSAITDHIGDQATALRPTELSGTTAGTLFQDQQQPPTPRRLFWWVTKKTTSMALAFATLLAVFQLRPSFYMEASTPAQPEEPFSAQFKIRNDSMFGLKAVYASCISSVWETRDVRLSDHPSGFSGDRESSPSLQRGEWMSLRCSQKYADDQIGPYSMRSLVRAELQLHLEYSVAIFPWYKMHSDGRFVGTSEYGIFTWSREPLSEYRGWPPAAMAVNASPNSLLVEYLTKPIPSEPQLFGITKGFVDGTIPGSAKEIEIVQHPISDRSLVLDFIYHPPPLKQ